MIDDLGLTLPSRIAALRSQSELHSADPLCRVLPLHRRDPGPKRGREPGQDLEDQRVSAGQLVVQNVN